MTKLQKLAKRLDALTAESRILEQQIAVEQSKQLVKCQGCKKSTQARKLTLVNVVLESSVTQRGGDRSYYICPKCNKKNRTYLYEPYHGDTKQQLQRKTALNAIIKRTNTLLTHFGNHQHWV